MKLLSLINESGDLVNKKYVDEAIDDVQGQIDTTKYWANVAVSESSSKTTTPTFSPDFLFNVASNTVIAGSRADLAIASPLTKYLWHDILSFGINGHPTVTTSADGGTTWAESDSEVLQKKLFIQREDQTVTVLDDTKTAIRWQWYSTGFHACKASYLNIGFAYSSSQARFNIVWETSTDGETWTTGFELEGVAYNSTPYWFYLTTNWSKSYWARLTLTRTSGTGTSANISGIKLLSSRWGNQGRGSEYELPYNWDYSQNIFPRTTDASSLGTSSYKWSNVYATTFTGALSGNATTATTATNLANAPSLASSGNNITVTAGGKTSSAFTVPYATSAGSATSATTATNLTNAPSLTANGDKIKVTIGDKSSSELTVPYATKAKGDASGNDIASTYAPKASPTFTGTPKAPTAASGTNTTQIATTAFVISEINSKLAASDAMQFKGTLGTGGTVTALPASHSKGDTYKVITAGTYAGVACEVGDMIICITDGTSANNAHWTVVQSNIDGAVTGPTSAVSGNVAIFNGTTGRVIKDSGIASSSIYQKTTYEWNNEISFGSSGKLCVGKFVMYDSAVVVEINATTNTTYHAILVIATQNHGTSSGGTIKATVYGDATNTISPNIKIYSHPANDGLVEVYFSPTGYSKNLVHIQAQGLSNRGTVSYSELAFDICTSVASIPSTATLVPTNALTENFASKSVATTSANGLMSAADKAKLDSNITVAGLSVALGGSITTENLQSALGLGALAYVDSLSKSDVGLGNVDNTADANKSVKYATSAGTASALVTATNIKLTGTAASTAHIQFSRSSYNYITVPSGGYLAIGTSASGTGITMSVSADAVTPYTTATKSIGTESLKWNSMYAVTMNATDMNATNMNATDINATNITATNFEGLASNATNWQETLLGDGVSLADITSPGYMYYTGGSNTTTDKPDGVDAFGMFNIRAASGWWGQMLFSSNTSQGVYYRIGTSNMYNNGLAWKTLLDSSNFTTFADARYYTRDEIDSTITGSSITIAGNEVALGGSITASTLKTSLSLNNVENTKLSTWTGSSYITKVGTLSSLGVSGTSTFTGILKIQNGAASGSFVLGANVNATTLTADTRKLGRMGVPSYDSTTKTVAGISFDSQVQANYADFGGHPNNAASIAPDVIRFVVANAHDNTINGGRTLALQISKQDGLVDSAGGGTSVAAAKFFVPIQCTSNISNDGTITSTGGFVGNISGNASSASKLTTVSKTAWGQTFWTSSGVPTSISGNMTGVGSISASGDVTTSNGLFKSTKNGNTLTIGSQNTSWCHFANSADVKFHFNKEVNSAGGFKIYNTSHGLSSAGALTAATGSFSSTLAVTSTSTFTGKTTHNGGIGTTTLTASGATTLSSTLAVTGASTFTGKTTHNGGLAVAAGKNLEVGSSIIIYNSTTGCLEITA